MVGVEDTGVTTKMVVGMMLIASSLFAQTRPAQPVNPDEQGAKRRYQITLMENVLASAVRHAAETMGRRIQSVSPTVVLLTGAARARGFVVPDYGVFFDVEVPALPLSVAWTMKVMERDFDVANSLEVLRNTLGSLTLTDAQRRDVDQALRRIELGVGPVGPGPGMPESEPRVRASGAVQAATVVPPPVATPGTLTPSPNPPAQDPGSEYTDVVKSELIDVMLQYGGPNLIGPDEWLTVAARDSYGPVNPAEIYDATTVVLRIKGSDLLAFRAGRLTQEEARKRVESREF
jgi:hypothetical protein